MSPSIAVCVGWDTFFLKWHQIYTLVVRRLTVPAEVKQFICEKRVFQGLRPGSLDDESFFAADENGLLAN